VGAPHHAKNIMTIIRPLEKLHMDLFGPIAYISISSNKYGLIIVDDYSRFTWVFFLHDKSETQEVLKKFLKRAQNKFDAKVKKIRSDNDSKFKNTQVEDYLDQEGIKHKFRHPILHNKIELSLSRQGQCLMNTRPLTTFGLKLSTRRVTP
jgi:transposase InsO family protein